MSRISFHDDGSVWEDDDDGYRTCSKCGGDCLPEPTEADGYGIRIIWRCPQHGVNSVADPFDYLRERGHPSN